MSSLRKKLIIISGSSGVGKGTVIKSLLERNYDIKLSVSCTTRAPRVGEIEGINYFYKTRAEFEKSVKNDEFIEWAEFSGNLYGTKKDFVLNSIKNGEHVLLEIDTQGGLQIKEKMNEAILIFIAPPSYQELEARLRGRKTETEENIQKRLKFVELEKKNSEKYDYIIINDTVANAVEQIEKIISQ